MVATTSSDAAWPPENFADPTVSTAPQTKQERTDDTAVSPHHALYAMANGIQPKTEEMKGHFRLLQSRHMDGGLHSASTRNAEIGDARFELRALRGAD